MKNRIIKSIKEHICPLFLHVNKPLSFLSSILIILFLAAYKNNILNPFISVALIILILAFESFVAATAAEFILYKNKDINNNLLAYISKRDVYGIYWNNIFYKGFGFISIIINSTAALVTTPIGLYIINCITGSTNMKNFDFITLLFINFIIRFVPLTVMFIKTCSSFKKLDGAANDKINLTNSKAFELFF